MKYRDVNGDGVITGEDQTFIGNPWPKLFAGFTNNLSYKGITLNVLITGTYGNEVYNYLRNQNTNPNNINLGRNLFIDAFDYAKVEYAADDVAQQQPFLSNPDTKVARISGGNNNNNFERHTDKYVEDGSYI
ncbi:MAG: TonB-dependent receptor, partial [Cyclobacteriaceae bacterium]